MYDGLAEGAFLGTFGVNVNPLVVERGVGKGVDAFLVYLKPVGDAKLLAYVLGKFLLRIDCKHIFLGYYGLHWSGRG